MQAVARAAEETGLNHPGSNALHTEMLDCMLLDVYAKLNRIRTSPSITYLPHPPRKRLPDKDKLRYEILQKVSSMPNPPWEPPSREDGGDEAIELHRIHVNKYLSASLESCSLHSRTTATSEATQLLMTVAGDLMDMLTMEVVDTVGDLDRHGSSLTPRR
jgi:hypothetical protein